MDSRLGLPKNTVLDGSYRIERLIGSGGFGITYRAEDINLKTTVALKEYYPAEFGAARAEPERAAEVGAAQGDLRLGPHQLPARGADARPLPPSRASCA